MTDASEDVLKFVLLLEDHKEVLSKSQTIVNKKKKDEAVALIIPKWFDISKTQLTQASLCKKINNLKTRAKFASRSGKTLNEWQAKLLKIIQSDEDEENSQINDSDIGEDNVDMGNAMAAPLKMNAEQILNELETDQTKGMNNDQLQRFVLLQQVQVVTLQRKRLEHLNSIESGKSVTFGYIGFEEEMDGVDPTNAKV